MIAKLLSRAGFSDVTGFWSGAEIDFPVSMGDYKFADTPRDPVILHLSKIPLTGDPSMSAREQARQRGAQPCRPNRHRYDR